MAQEHRRGWNLEQGKRASNGKQGKKIQTFYYIRSNVVGGKDGEPDEAQKKLLFGEKQAGPVLN